MKKEELRYLQRLSELYPTIAKASTEIINLQSILNLPKGTEHFMSDIHGEYDAFSHVLRNGSGAVRKKIDDVFGHTLSNSDKRSLATLIYYPKEKMEVVKKHEEDMENWYKITLYRLIEVCKTTASKYTRSKVRKALPADYAYVIEELITEKAEVLDKEAYYDAIVNTIIEIGRAENFIIALAELIQRLVVDHLHVLGDIYDRGPGPHFIMDRLMKYHSLDIQWGNHDVVWMGAAVGQRACIATVLRNSIRYGNLDILEDGYGINMLPLATFAMEVYKDDPCTAFEMKGTSNYNALEKELGQKMHKAIAIIQFKLEGQLLRRHKEFHMEDRCLLHRINPEKGTVTLADGKEYADILEAELKSQRYPLLETVVTIGISADNLEEMEKKAVTVRGIYEDFAFGIERPLADQLKLFMQCIPGMGVLTGDYTMPLTPVTLGSGIIGATHELGDHVGPYIGTTGAEGKQVFLDLGRACLLNKSASATFYGNLGVGKSFNANLLLFLTVLYGGYGLIFDPKGERSHWVEQFPLLQGQISLVTLSPDRTNQGKLDPYNMYLDNRDEADELAINVISELLRIAPASEEYTAILEAQRIMRDEDVPSMKKLIAILKEFPREDELSERARYLARRLGLQAETGMSRLLFGDGSEDAITLKNRLNILQIENLKMPSPSTPKDNYTSEELQSLVLMAVASHFAKKFALEKRDVFSVVLFDESWMLGKTAEGVKLFDYLSRMGRSLYTGCIFNGHSVTDIPSEGIKNTISYKFCFQTTTDGEAERMCEYMDLEATQETAMQKDINFLNELQPKHREVPSGSGSREERRHLSKRDILNKYL